MSTIISTREAAIKLGISQEAVTMAIRRGYIKAVKLGREWAVDKHSVLEYKQRREASPNGRYQPV